MRNTIIPLAIEQLPTSADVVQGEAEKMLSGSAAH
jgi:hypothetical protein